RNPRSTVGTTTEIHEYMRLLFARVGRTFCRQCGQEVIRETAEVVARQLGELPTGSRVLIGFELPVVPMPPELQAADPDEATTEHAVEVAVERGKMPGPDQIVETLQLLRR